MNKTFIFNLSEISLTTEIFLSCSILQLTFYAISTTTQRKYGFVLLSTQIYSIGALILFFSIFLISNEDLLLTGSLSANNSIVNDYLSYITKLVICITSFLYILILKISSEDEPIQHNFEYVVLILVSVLGSLLICSSNDLLTAYLSIELQSVSFYLMAAFKKNSSYSIESGLKYFIIGSLSSAFFLFGSSIIYGCTGSLNFNDLKIFYSLLNVNPTAYEENAYFYLTSKLSTYDLYYNFCLKNEHILYLSVLFFTNVEELYMKFDLLNFYYHKRMWIPQVLDKSLVSWIFEKNEKNNVLFEEYPIIKSVYMDHAAYYESNEKIFTKFIFDRAKFMNSLPGWVAISDMNIYMNRVHYREMGRPDLIAIGGFTLGNMGTLVDFYSVWDNPLTNSYFASVSSLESTNILKHELYLENTFLNYKVNIEPQLKTLFSNVDNSLINSSFNFLNNIWYHTNLSFNDFIHIAGNSMVSLNLISIGFILVCISLFIKLALAPFHFWSLDVYEGSPNYTTAFFAIVPKIAIFVLLFRICYLSFFDCFYHQWQTSFFLISLISIFVGSVGGLEQRKLKTLMAYSSINHTGYLMLAFSSGSVEGVLMMFYYLTIFMISGLCFWSVYLFLKPKRDNYLRKHNRELGDLVLLRDSNPMLAFILAITLFSLAGIPPLVGFLAKIGIFLSAMGSSAYLVSVVSVLLSVISTFYYIRIIKILYFENVLVGKLYHPISTNKSLLISILSLMLILLCVNPTLLYLLFIKAGLLSIF